MPVQIQPNPQPTNELEVQAVEARIGAPLPPVYRAFLLAGNGGTAAYNADGVRLFFSATPDDPAYLFAQFAATRDLLPAKLCPIAVDRAGNFYCISLQAPDAGAVYFCDGDSEAAATEISRIAPGFDEFLQELEALDPDALTRVAEENLEAWINPEWQEDWTEEATPLPQRPAEPKIKPMKVQVRRRAPFNEGPI